jgi:hypothetical protein
MRRGFRLAVGIASLSVVLIATGGGGLVAPVDQAPARGLLTPDPPPLPAPKLSIKAPKKAIAFGEQASLHVRGENILNRVYEIDVYELPWPYDKENLVATLHTGTADTSLNAPLQVHPKFNTRYRAEVRGLPETTTDSPAIWVNPRRVTSDTRYLNRRKGRIEVSMKLDVSPKLPYDFSGKRLIFYFFEKGTNRIIPKATTRTRVPSPGHVRGSARYRIPTDHAYRFFTYWCFDTKEADVGAGEPMVHKCPRKTVAVGDFAKGSPVADLVASAPAVDVYGR